MAKLISVDNAAKMIQKGVKTYWVILCFVLLRCVFVFAELCCDMIWCCVSTPPLPAPTPSLLCCVVLAERSCTVLSCVVLCCVVVWCGVVWCGVVWCGVVWCGVVWCGVWCGVVWWCGMVCWSVLSNAVMCSTVLCCSVTCCAVLYWAVVLYRFVLCWLSCVIQCRVAFHCFARMASKLYLFPRKCTLFINFVHIVQAA